ncbi:MAG: LemA family protein [Bacillota bacterium]
MWIILVVLMLMAFFFIFFYNRLVVLRQRVKNSWSQVDVQLKRRYDLIPNLVNVVKAYAKHEKETFTRITEARSQAVSADSTKKQAEAENFLSSALQNLFAVVENYPELKANENFRELQNDLSETENKIAFARQFYNDTVQNYNIRVETFPSNIIAGIIGFKQEEFFNIDDPKEKDNINITF